MDYRRVFTFETGRGGSPVFVEYGGRSTTCSANLASGVSREEILCDFPDLTPEDIAACLSYAADRERHQFAIAG